MEYRIIKPPSRGTLEILARRKGSGNAVKLEDVDAVGLVQGRLIEMVCAADVAEKAVGVTVEDIRGMIICWGQLPPAYDHAGNLWGYGFGRSGPGRNPTERKGGSGGMVTARLTGNIWATRKSDLLSGYKLLLAEVIGGTRAGESMVVIDTIGAGIGDRVIVACGSSARRMLGSDEIPADAAVVGIIDEDCAFEDS